MMSLCKKCKKCKKFCFFWFTTFGLQPPCQDSRVVNFYPSTGCDKTQTTLNQDIQGVKAVKVVYTVTVLVLVLGG